MYWVSWLTTNTPKKTFIEKKLSIIQVWQKSLFWRSLTRQKRQIVWACEQFLKLSPENILCTHHSHNLQRRHMTETKCQHHEMNAWLRRINDIILDYMIYLDLFLCLQLTTREKDTQMWMWYTDRLCLCHLHLQLITRTKSWINF